MNTAQRIIKYFAIAFATFLICSIFSGIIGGIGLFTGAFFDGDAILKNDKTIELATNYQNLEIDVATVSVTIKTGDTFLAETNNKNIKVEQKDQTLKIREKVHNLFGVHGNSKLILSIPADKVFEGVYIETGAGKLDIDTLLTDTLELNLGAGSVHINKMVVTQKTILDGGAGEIVVADGTLHNLDLDMGVGSVTLTSKITGNSEIDAGVGEINLNLLGSLGDYQIKVDKGIGDIKMNGQKIEDHSTTGSGSNRIEIDGGIGSIHIKISDNSVFDSAISNHFTKTYQLLNITSANEEGAYYLTLQVFQGEVATVLVRDMNTTLIAGKTYEFTFSKRAGSSTIQDHIESIFQNAEIIDVKETTKTGLDQTQDSIHE